MLKIISLKNNALFICVPVIDSIHFQPGMIAQNFNGKFGPSNGIQPYGIIDDIRDNLPIELGGYTDSTMGGKLTIWNCNGIYQTDIFDKSLDYKPKMPLYCNQYSCLSIIKPNQNYPQIGFVKNLISFNVLEFEWVLGQ